MGSVRVEINCVAQFYITLHYIVLKIYKYQGYSYFKNRWTFDKQIVSFPCPLADWPLCFNLDDSHVESS